jgi:hypothetical protein
MIEAFLLTAILSLGQAVGVTKAADPAAPTTAQPAAQSADAELAAKVKRLVLLLDDDVQAKREAAEKELVALGGDVLPLLPAISSRTPAEMKNRLGRVRAALMKTAVAATAKAVFVSLSGEMPVSKAIAELTKQSGNPLVDYREKFNQ